MSHASSHHTSIILSLDLISSNVYLRLSHCWAYRVSVVLNQFLLRSSCLFCVVDCHTFRPMALVCSWLARIFDRGHCEPSRSFAKFGWYLDGLVWTHTPLCAFMSLKEAIFLCCSRDLFYKHLGLFIDVSKSTRLWDVIVYPAVILDHFGVQIKTARSCSANHVVDVGTSKDNLLPVDGQQNWLYCSLRTCGRVWLSFSAEVVVLSYSRVLAFVTHKR